MKGISPIIAIIIILLIVIAIAGAAYAYISIVWGWQTEHPCKALGEMRNATSSTYGWGALGGYYCKLTICTEPREGIRTGNQIWIKGCEGSIIEYWWLE